MHVTTIPRVAFAVLLAWLPARTTFAQSVPDFNRDVRPILSRHCFKCHGPDEGQRKAGLNLLGRAGAIKKLASGDHAVKPGNPDESTLIKRINTTGALQMPPVAENKPLTSAQKTILRQWITSGAKYEDHWAFVVPKQKSPPNVKLASWPRNPIDNFILAKLEAAGLKPSPEASRATLIRRVSLDLIGLPPTPEEVNAFINDKSPNAYERVVDRLLANPHYGERWARKWLDLARYADTNGFEKDRTRSVWPYRDWVINALNADMPFDQFTIEQIAGDMLPGATLNQRIATGFHRNTMLNEEGGIDPLEYRFYNMVDRTNVTGTVWLGLTVGCAQCHTHKFDPLPHRDYYRLMAFQDNTEEPEVEVPTESLLAARKKVEQQVAERQSQLASKFPAANGLSPEVNLTKRLAEWTGQQEAKAVHWQVVRPAKATSNLPLLTIEADNAIFVSGDQSKRDVYTLEFKGLPAGVTAIRLEVLPDDRLPKHGPGRTYYEGPFGDFFLSEFTVTSNGAKQKIAKATQSSDGAASLMIDGDPQSGWTINGGQGKAHTAVLNLAQPLPSGDVKMELLFERYHAANLGKFRMSVTTDQKPAEAGPPPAVESIFLKPAGDRTPDELTKVRAQFLAVAPELGKEREEIAKLAATAPAIPTAFVFEERPASNPRATFRHNRGEWLQPKEKVNAGILAVLPPLPAGAKPDRLNFAKWLVSPTNPLVGRVTVNRQWQAFFGRGIVRTLEDFGYQGSSPSHPELLDWLAVAFTTKNGDQTRQSASAWSMKKLHRLIVTSATYRQSSNVTKQQLAKDPENLLLSHMPRVRLEGEQLRDQALAASGLLSPKIGGPSVFPPQPASITAEGAYGSLQWKTSEGEDKYRRGMYTFAKRTAPYAMFQTFDGPSGEAICPRRDVTNTPLQALTVMNDQVFLEAAQALGKVIAERSGTADERANYLFQRCTSRLPSASELKLLVGFYERQKKRLVAKEIDPAIISGASEGDLIERAAWTTVARSVLNLDEVVVRR
jgi:hypothetical protein